MVQPSATQISCPNCHQGFSAVLEQIIDAGRDSQAKARLLAGRTNLVTCPHCGYQTRLATPLVYHDPDKELLLVHLPMELGLPQREQDRLVGNLTNAIINSMPTDQRKGYLLMPKMALTLQGMIETILEADGITKEVIEARRGKLRLVETFLQTDPNQWEALAQQHDSELDQEFFAMLTASAETALSNGRQDVAEQVLVLRERLLELSTVGQQALQNAARQEATIKSVADALNALGENPTHADFVELTLRLAAGDYEQGKDESLQVLVGLARPVMDYTFFQTLSEQSERAQDTEEQKFITDVRDRLLELTSVVDQQNEAILREANDTLRAILSNPDMEAGIRARLDMIDDTFLAVLSANIQAAEESKDAMLAAQLKAVFDRILAILQENAPPIVQFLNDLMMRQDFEEAKALLSERAQEFGPELLQWMDMLGNNMAARGNQKALERLTQLRQVAKQIVGPMPPYGQPPAEEADDGRQPDSSPIILPFSRKRRDRQ